jgi:Transposase IS4
MESAKKEGNARFWRDTCGAEIKAFFAAAFWYSLLIGSTFKQHRKKEAEQEKLAYWFPSETRWTQLKRFLKLSDPLTDKDHSADRVHRIRELLDFFTIACKVQYIPGKILL